jgi:hypothetical protein
MTVLSGALREPHAGILDLGIDSVGGYSVQDGYLPGVPYFFPGGWGWVGNFGAALTPLPDSSLLVYSAVTPHPLGLVPGDIVLGYDRVPWNVLCKELLDAELPVQFIRGGTNNWGSTPRARTHGLLNSAGNHWGLYDTIDVVKWASGDTLHLATAALAGQGWKSLFASEQVAVPGVRMPEYGNNEFVTWGVVENTSVGYVYAYSWHDEAAGPFASAINDLVKVRKVSGLILDFRYNRGGSITAADAGLEYLFNQNPAGASRWLAAERSDPFDHLGFSYEPPFDAGSGMAADYYDRPIAVLLGPQCYSAGDYTAFRMRFHPMARLFGLPTNGAFVAGAQVVVSPAWGTWYYGFYAGQMVSLLPTEGFLVHKSFPVDEEIWLTRDGAARGEDDVVKRALEWIATLTHAHELTLDRTYVFPGTDSVSLTARLTNPLGHAASLSAIVCDEAGAVRDSVLLCDDGAHGDSSAGDGIWGCRIPAPAEEISCAVSLRTDDLTMATFRRLPTAVHFTTAGPVACIGDTASTTPAWGKRVRFRFRVVNSGLTRTIPLVSGVARSLDSAASVLSGGGFTVGDLLPGESKLSGPVTVSFTAGVTRLVSFELLFASSGVEYWRDTVQTLVTDVERAADSPLPTTYRLDQNFPNPFNPTTEVRYQLPVACDVRMSVCDLLGRELTMLVHERKDAGVHTVHFDASGLSSGAYFYRIQAGGYIHTRRMLLLR